MTYPTLAAAAPSAPLLTPEQHARQLAAGLTRHALSAINAAYVAYVAASADYDAASCAAALAIDATIPQDVDFGAYGPHAYMREWATPAVLALHDLCQVYVAPGRPEMRQTYASDYYPLATWAKQAKRFATQAARIRKAIDLIG